MSDDDMTYLPVAYEEIRHEYEDARNNLVAKRNDMIQRSRFALDTVETKAVAYMISKIQPDDKPGKRYTFSCNEFKSLIRWKNKGSYTEIKTMLTKLSQKAMWIDIDEQTESLVRWFHIVHMNKGTGDVEISFHDDMVPYLLSLRQQQELGEAFYTVYKLQYVTLFSHRYSSRLYEILKSYSNRRRWQFEVGTGSLYDLQRILADPDPVTGKPMPPASWKNFAVFRRDVLDPSVKEINLYTDIKCTYEGKKETLSHTKTRGIRSVVFYMVAKTDTEQKETDSTIDSIYMEAEVVPKYHQMTLDEIFFAEHEEKVREDEEAKAEAQREKDDEMIAMSRFPLLMSGCFARGLRFTEEQVEFLGRAAMSAGTLPTPLEFRDLYTTDYVTHYIEVVTATAENTRTTLFNRLYDMVRKDYDHIADDLKDYYGSLQLNKRN